MITWDMNNPTIRPAWCHGCDVGSAGSLQNKWALQQQKCGLTSKKALAQLARAPNGPSHWELDVRYFNMSMSFLDIA